MKWKLWLNIATLVALALLILLARHDIVRAIERAMTLNWAVLLLLIPLLFSLFYVLAKFYQAFFRAIGQKLPLKVLVPAMMELNFVNHVFPSGGLSGASYFAWRLKPFEVSTAKAALAQLTRFVFAFVGYICMMFLSLVLLAIDGHTSSVVVLIVSAITFTLLFTMLVLVFVLGSEQRVIGFTRGLFKIINKVIHVVRPKHPETINLRRVRQTLLELHKDYVLIKTDYKKMRSVFFWSIVVSVGELALLYITFVAHGAWVNPGAVVVAFVIANTAGLVAVLPGGIGIFEPLMSAVLISVGVPAGLAVSATLIYRTVTLVLSLLAGGALYQKAINKYGTADI